MKSGTGFKVKTSLQAGKCCWNAYSAAVATGNSSDVKKFADCCSKDPNCTFAKYAGGWVR